MSPAWQLIVPAAVLLLAAVAWRWRNETSAGNDAAANRCAFEYRASSIAGAGNGLYTLLPLRSGALCCTYDGDDFAAVDASPAALEAIESEYLQEDPLGGGFRVGYVPARSSCGVVQLANDAHRVELSHPTRLSAAVQAVVSYEALSQSAEGGNNIRQRPGGDPRDPFSFYATRDVRPGEELFQAYGYPFWLDHLTRRSERPTTRLLLCLARATCDRMRGQRPQPCTTLRRKRDGREIQFVYSEAEVDMMQGDGSPLTEVLASAFVLKYLRVAADSPIFDALPADEEPARPLAPLGSGSARGRLRRLVRHLAADGLTTDAHCEWEERA